MTALKVGERQYSPEEVLQLSQQGQDFELFNGELIPMAPAKLTQGELAAWLAYLLTGHVLPNKLGKVYGAETGFTLPNGDVLATDVAFISLARIPPSDDQPGFTRVVPDLVIEIFSDSNTKIEMQEKADAFFPAGTRLMWVIYPRSRSVYVYTAPDKVTILKGEAIIDGGNVLPGFSVKVSEIFRILDE